MSQAATWPLVLCALGVVLVRRRRVAIALIAAQSLLLGVAAIGEAAGASTALLAAGVVLVAKAIALPALLAVVVNRTREARLIASERHPLARLTLALAIALAIVALVPRGPLAGDTEHAGVGLIALGIAIAILRPQAIFQALGFLVAENGLYFAALSTPGGLPVFIELGLVFDLVVVVTVAGVFSAKIHETLGTGDTSLLGGPRDD